MTEKVTRSDAEWRSELTPEHVLEDGPRPTGVRVHYNIGP
jgi:hypothetical protein